VYFSFPAEAEKEDQELRFGAPVSLVGRIIKNIRLSLVLHNAPFFVPDFVSSAYFAAIINDKSTGYIITKPLC
jgi:hypothetical protein